MGDISGKQSGHRSALDPWAGHPEAILEAPQDATPKLPIPRARMQNQNELSAGKTKA